MRPAVVVLLCLLAAVVGAAAVVAGEEQGGWFQTTVLVRAALARPTTPTIIVSKPVLGRGFAPSHIFAERSPGVVTVYATFGSGKTRTEEQGSGFVVDRRGDILTAAHVVVSMAGASPLETPARLVRIVFNDGAELHASIVGWDPYDDVAVLRVDPRDHALDPLPLGSSSNLVVGQPVAAIGSPFGNASSLSVGVVSGTGRTIPSLATPYDVFDAIQIDAPINAGNSGGPLLDAQGRVIGINAQIRSDLATAFEGVGFAVPVDSVKRSLDQLLRNGRVPYAYLGMQTENLTPALARRFGYPAVYGALVAAVVKGGPAARAGLHGGTQRVVFDGQQVAVGGDAIVAVDGSPIVSSDAIAELVSERLVPGEVAWFTIFRNGHRHVVAVTLGTRPQ